MKRNITIWQTGAGQWVADFSVDLYTAYMYTPPHADVNWTEIIDNWVNRGTVPAHARRVEAE